MSASQPPSTIESVIVEHAVAPDDPPPRRKSLVATEVPSNPEYLAVTHPKAPGKSLVHESALVSLEAWR